MKKLTKGILVIFLYAGGVSVLLTLWRRVFHRRAMREAQAEYMLDAASQDAMERLDRATKVAKEQLLKSMTNKGYGRRRKVERSAKRAKKRLVAAVGNAVSMLEEVENISQNDYAGV